MTEEKTAPSKLHWPGIIWVVWNFFTVFNFAFAVVTILVIGSLLFEGIPTEYMIPLKIIFIAGGVYAAFALTAAIAMLLKRKLGWVLAFCVLGISTLLAFFFGIGWTVAFRPDLEVFTGMALALGVNVAWLVYFIKARRRYGVVSRGWEPSKKQPLHWPALVWVVGHFVLPAGFLINLLDRLSTPHGLNPLFHPYLSNLERVYLIVAYFAYLPISIVAAITMIVNRRIGWVCAFVTLFISTVYFAIRALPEQYQYGSTEAALLVNITTAVLSILAIGVNVAWLVYFIKARRRYGVVSHD